MKDFLGQFIDNADRAKLVRVFVFDESRALTLGDAMKRSGLSARAAANALRFLTRMEIIKTENLSIMLKNKPGKSVSAVNQKVSGWRLNPDFKYARALTAFVHEVSTVKHDTIMNALKRTGKISAVILSGNFMGDPSRPADLIVAADAFIEGRMEKAVRDLEPQLGREIRYATFSTPEFRYRLTIQDRLIRDTLDFPHLVLLDRTRML